MIEKMMALAMDSRLMVLVLVAVISGLGLFAFISMPIDAFPDVTNVQVEIISNAPGLSPLEIEQFVTYRIEMAMRGIPGLELMRSTTKYGLSVVTLVFNDKTDIYFARQLVFERLTSVKDDLPAGVDSEMGPIATAMGEIYQYTLQGKEPDDSNEKIKYLTQLRTLQDWVIAPILKDLPGVNEINSFGGYLKQFEIMLKPDKLLTYDVSVQDIIEAVQQNNQNVGGNVIESPTEQHIIRGIGLIRDENDISQIVLKSHDGVPVYIGDLAEVTSGHAVRQGLALKDGKGEAVGGVVLMLKGQNSREVVERIKAKVAGINSSTLLPDGIKIAPYYDRSMIVDKAIKTVSTTLLEGAVLVIIVLYVLLRSFRGALIVILALPLSMLLTFIVMYYAGLNANLMSLGGLAISIGMIIDATIIQVENVQRHLSQTDASGSKLSAVLKAVLEVRKPSIFGEFIIALTFIPILMLQGMEGKMFAPLAYTVAIALFCSMFLSIFVIPVLCSVLLKHGSHAKSPVIEWANRVYMPVLEWAISRRKVVLGTSALLIIIAVSSVPWLGREFMPVMDEGAFDMDIQLPPGTSLERSGMISLLVQKRLMQFEELENLIGKTGQTGIAIEARGVEKTGYVGTLKPRSQWKNARTREELFEKMRKAVEDIPGIAYGFSQPIQCRIDELVAGTRAQVIVKLFGDDSEILKAKTAQIAAVLSRVQGATDLVPEVVAGQPYVSIKVDRQKIARYGINVSDVLNVIGVAMGGSPVSEIYQGSMVFDVVTRLPEESRASADAISELMINTKQGYSLPLSQLAQVSIEEGPVQISRENARRRMAVELNVSGRDIGGFVKEAQQLISSEIELPTGYWIEWGGQFENQQQAMRRLSLITPIIISVILLLLFLTFKSFGLAVLVIATLPFALVGGIFSLHISQTYLSVPASVGFIVLFGVAVLNGVVLVSYIIQLRGSGLDAVQAVIAACKCRLRPILMTALITILALVPMMLASGPGSEVQKPLAVIVIGGLVTSTLATLLVLPVLYCWFDRRNPAKPRISATDLPVHSADLV